VSWIKKNVKVKVKQHARLAEFREKKQRPDLRKHRGKTFTALGAPDRNGFFYVEEFSQALHVLEVERP